MHGVILDEMRQFVAERYGYRKWLETLKRSGHPPGHRYALDRVYPDDELTALARSAAEATGTPLAALLEAFGEAMLPDMMRTYSHLVDPRWSYAEFLLNLEPLLVAALQLHTPDSAQAKIRSRRLDPDTVEIVYDSPLKACPAVHGIILAAAGEYAAQAEVVQSRCALRGDPTFVFRITIRQPAAA